MIRSAMILAAGRGERMRPLTDTIPKPLIPVAGRSMLDRAMDRLQEHNVRNLVINVHHLGEQVAAHVGGSMHRPKRTALHEKLVELEVETRVRPRRLGCTCRRLGHHLVAHPKRMPHTGPFQ